MQVSHRMQAHITKSLEGGKRKGKVVNPPAKMMITAKAYTVLNSASSIGTSWHSMTCIGKMEEIHIHSILV